MLSNSALYSSAFIPVQLAHTVSALPELIADLLLRRKQSSSVTPINAGKNVASIHIDGEHVCDTLAASILSAFLAPIQPPRILL